MFDINSLILEQVIFEVKYEHGYLYWDNCGKIWKVIHEAFPNITLETVSTESAIFKLKNEEIILQFSPNNIVVSEQYPNNLKTIGELADAALNIITKYLEIETFTRIGNRFQYLVKVKDAEEAIELLKKTGFFNIPTDKVVKIGNMLKEPHLKFVVTKDDEKGYIFNLTYLERTINLKLPKIVKADVSGLITKAFLIDIDYYTLKPVDCSIVRPLDLLKKNKSDIDYLIKEIFA